MNFKALGRGTNTINQHCSRLSAVLYLFLCLLFLFSAPGLVAQVQEQIPELAAESGQEPAEEPEVVTVSLPASYQMAMALATPGLRENALLDLAVAAKVLSRVEEGLDIDHTGLAKNYLDDCGWVQMLRRPLWLGATTQLGT